MSATPVGETGARATRAVAPGLLLLAVIGLPGARPLLAQEARGQGAPQAIAEEGDGPETGRAAAAAKFILGGAAGLGLHEGGHLLFDGLFDAHPDLKKVDFGGIPFFAITHRPGLSPRRDFVITSAGFWAQHASSEVVLTRYPHLREQSAPVLKGMLAFNVLASMAYGGAAMAKAGPVERDTRGMAAALRVGEPWVGVLVMIPAGLDAWRYYHPDARWAKWLSRGVKVGAVLLVAR